MNMSCNRCPSDARLCCLQSKTKIITHGPTVVALGTAIISFFFTPQVRVDNHYSFQDIGSVMAVTGCYSTTEPLIDAQCDIYIQKIGSHYRAFM